MKGETSRSKALEEELGKIEVRETPKAGFESFEPYACIRRRRVSRGESLGIMGLDEANDCVEELAAHSIPSLAIEVRI
jgi:hypothetical protein